ncbi:hypothetical protein PGT21_004970 [Puccinia graminis f. sp. tritici]|uniref:Uncharacterized protein n=1 Tax=Puccinia graminis f. sp. tritici TaxID=56615 RepID=A0A5B0RWM6_PUCGR|nr:hypothetical protein PGT21_004970 [Puccinia graminis f. sp. tritici]KAA1130401.1 hypothetical protein PGTUg99_012449 [Puccinia graminis f. sp. tritici]
MKFFFTSLAIITLISKVWGIVEEINYDLKKYYVFTGDSLMNNDLPGLSVVPNQQNERMLQANVYTMYCKNGTNNILQIWTDKEKLVTFQPNEEKRISWHKSHPLMVLTQNHSVHLQERMYIEIIYRYRFKKPT